MIHSKPAPDAQLKTQLAAPRQTLLMRLTLKAIPKKLRLRWQKWLAKRIPASRQFTLSHKSIFILPSAFGLAWIGLILLLYLFGTNYQNNLIIGLSLLLASLFQTCIIYSYKNLAGLRLSAIKNPQIYAGGTASFAVELSHHDLGLAASQSNPHGSRDNRHQQICLRFANQHHVRVKHVINEQLTYVPLDNCQRGRLNPGRITVESYFPLGLCRTWSYVDLDLQQIIFAKPKPYEIILSAADKEAQEDEHGLQRAGVSEFNELRAYVPGESLKQVAWKQWAQGKGLLTKTFSQPQGKPLWLLLANITGHDIEERLSKLAWQVDELSRRQQVFGVVLDNAHTIEQNIGDSHRITCQQAIALFQTKSGRDEEASHAG
ncbi:DUF58 domain-containing protein [Shewanella sp. SR44-3]|uniref:DUF58 domain-containing protein n=1 Tax=Shewanella sp. SR44-3 TaxID=2760936 RepID=UPI0021759CCA|nr:DUF58 domain-containing protein [Shewanella sp. SR44-3]